ncbi:MAG: helicase-exonuclease AddAB subunit AddA [Clostridia bacterium]|nr:helicase-exonuclease AddAB subunit AddA [Clostridia bacterium]
MPEWTKEQKRAIEEKGNNILVAAAAGSGKTTVLVERVIQKIIKDRIDIDRLLIVTFTNAAASEMRERILNALYKEIDKNPTDIHLQKQIVLLNKANICTIDAFCLEIIKNNFFEIGISSNFRIADNIELELLKQEAMEDLFEKLYLDRDKKFEKLIDIYAGYKGDETLKELIFKIYDNIQSNPFQYEWLDEKIEYFNVKKHIEEDFSKSKWGKVLIENYRNEIIDEINSLKVIKNRLQNYTELEKYYNVINNDIDGLNDVKNSLNNWDEAYNVSNNLKFKTWPTDKKVTMDLKDEAKSARDIIKEKYNKITKKTFIYNSKEAYQDIYEMYDILKNLGDLVVKFAKCFEEKKLEKNIMDFGDIEHNALKILIKKDKNGNYIPSEIAEKLKDKFEEIAIDEYQDSNLIQEYILTSTSKGNNIFMVGDVKQSIYKFRQARPELFLEKYETYSNDISENGIKGVKIQLFKNFRSRKSVIDLTNLLFDNIMSKKLGDIEYTKQEYLNFAANFQDSEDNKNKAELHIIDLKNSQKEDESIYEDDIYEDEDKLEENKKLEKPEIEAKYVAGEIKRIIDSEYKIYDKNVGYRNIQYKDIVILLRATSMVSNIYEKELYDIGIPVYSDTGEDYLETLEIQRIISLLKIIDNPYQDIPLLTVLRSPIFDFSDEELTTIRLVNRENYFYKTMEEAIENNSLEDSTKNKIKNLISSIEKWREEEKYLKLNELIWKIYIDTGYYSYVGLTKNGELKQANLKLLFEKAKDYEKISFKGLFNFVKYIEKIKKSNADMNSAKIIGENENVVRIMSIHKSKGLEFPVVFLCRSDKNINMRSLNENILLDQDLGIGPKYINYERKIEYNTAAREAVRLKSKNESISEEMRILYVALTRAKEKLIIVGIKNDYEKDIDNKKELLKIYEKEQNNKINHLLVQKYTSYLDWLELMYLNNIQNINDYLEMKIINEDEINIELEQKNEEYRLEFSKDKELNKLDETLNWEYKYILDTLVPSKTSVTKIKKLINLENKDKLEKIIAIDDNENNNALEIKPEFMKDEKITQAQKGTIIHLCLQKLDLKRNYNMSDIVDLINKLEYQNIITNQERKSININKIKNFVDSEFAERIRNAKFIEKEKPFYTYVKAKDIYNNSSEENILVQGIIDLYFIEKNGNVVLVDYKTDYVTNENELIEKYKTQLELYKNALEKSLNKKIKDTFIYSVYLGKEIKIDE